MWKSGLFEDHPLATIYHGEFTDHDDRYGVKLQIEHAHELREVMNRYVALVDLMNRDAEQAQQPVSDWEPHKTMTAEEYAASNLKGSHWTRYNEDGTVDVRYCGFTWSTPKQAQRPRTECLSCDEGAEACSQSKRQCGHHCNCSWVHDKCCWCGKEFGEAEEEQPALDLEPVRRLVEAVSSLNSYASWASVYGAKRDIAVDAMQEAFPALRSLLSEVEDLRQLHDQAVTLRDEVGRLQIALAAAQETIRMDQKFVEDGVKAAEELERLREENAKLKEASDGKAE